MFFKHVGICSDHAGIELKSYLLAGLKDLDLSVYDVGPTASPENVRVDYPDYAKLLATKMQKGLLDGGIAICGTGLGMCISANKFRGIRACSAWDEMSARLGREHNDANVLCLGARMLHPARALDLVQLWLQTAFLFDRHALRLEKIAQIERESNLA